MENPPQVRVKINAVTYSWLAKCIRIAQRFDVMRRLLISLSILLTGLMIAITPVAASVVLDRTDCAQMAHKDMAHHSAVEVDNAAHHEMGGSFQASAETAGDLRCCDYGSVFDLSAIPLQHGADSLLIPVSKRWTSSDLTDLTGPFGLQRPPKA